MKIKYPSIYKYITSYVFFYYHIYTYTVMEYCPFSLQLLIEKSVDGHLAIPYAHKYFKQLIDGLEYIHSHNVIRMLTSY